MSRMIRDPHHVFIWLVVLILVLLLWVRPIFSSFWLDELGTWWVIKDDLGAAIDRSLEYHGQSPLYYVIAWGWSRVGGTSEAMLRLPSILAFAAATLLLYRLARRLLDPEVARISVVTFAGSIVAFAASELRPYSLAILLLIAATLVLVRWLDGGGIALTISYPILVALVVWAHYLFILGLLAHIPYYLVRYRQGSTRVEPWTMFASWAAALLLTAPLAAQLLSLYGRRNELVIPGSAGLLDLIFAVVSPAIAVPLVLGAGLATLSVVPVLSPRKASGGSFALIVPWAVVPPLVLLGLTFFTPLEFTSNRYLFSAAPGISILSAWFIASLSPDVVRRVCVASVAIVAILAFGSPIKSNQDWRSAVSLLRDRSDRDTLILAHPKLIESRQLDWFDEPERVSYLLSPFSYYSVPGELILLPNLLDDAGVVEYLDNVTSTRLEPSDRFLLITRAAEIPYREWLDGRLSDEWTWDEIGLFGDVEVIEFRKREGEQPAA